MPLVIPFFFFFVSGACALIYEVVWMRQLLLVVGSTTTAVSTVLGVFMAGLGLGASLFGPRADRSRSPLKLYAHLELGIGLYALLLPTLVAASARPYVAIARRLAGHPGPLLLVRVTLGVLLLLVPTVLMGGTLPVLVRFVGRTIDGLGADLGRLYAANLAGGVLGSLLCGFVLIRALGVQGATMAAVLGNLLIGLVALLWAERVGAADRGAPTGAAASAGRFEIPAAARPLVWAAAFLSGFLSMAYEVVWTRILIFAFHSSVYSFTLILSTFLTGLAIGSRLFVALRTRARPLPTLAAALILAGVTALLLAPVSARSADLIQAVSSRFGVTGVTFFGTAALCAALVILVPATLMGLVLPMAMSLLVEDLARVGRRIGAAYLVNTVGSVAGSVAAGFLLIPLVGLKGTLVLLGAAQVALGWAVLAEAGISARRRVQVLAGSGAALLAVAVAVALLLRGPSPFDPLGGGAVVEAHRDGAAASTSVVRYPGGGRALRIDGFEASSDIVVAGSAGYMPWGAGYMPMMTHIPMLLHPDPRRLLVICFGTGATAGAGLLHPGTSLDVVDINPAVFEFAPYFEGANHGVAKDARARLVLDDGRNFLLTTSERYDVITAEPMPPRFAGVVNLYSREYYQLARERLRPGGFVVQWLPAHLTTFSEARRILRTIEEVFPETTLWLHGGTGIIVSRRDLPVVIDLDRLRRGYANDALRADLVRLGAPTPWSFATMHALGPEAIRLATAPVRAITDDHPSLEFHRIGAGLGEGAVSLEESRSMELIQRLRSETAPPAMKGATAEESEAVARYRKAESGRALAEIYAQWGLGRRPEEEPGH